MGTQVYTKKNFAIIDMDEGYIVINKDKEFKQGHSLLIGRDLLSEPVQIKAGDSYKFIYKVSLNAQSVIKTE